MTKLEQLPRVIDKFALAEALELARLAGQEPNADQRRELQDEAVRLWQQAHGRRA
jgi:hypothetical protein